MRKIPHYYFLGRLLLVGIVALSFSAHAAPGESEAELAKLRGRINSLQQQLEQTRDERDIARSALRPVERRISEQIKVLRKSSAELVATDRKLNTLRSRQQTARTALGARTRELAQHARAAYALGQQDRLKMLLNQQEPAALGRVLTYYRYFADARASRINFLNNELQQLTQLETTISHRRHELETIKKRRELEKQALEKSRHRRATLLASLDHEISSSTREIARLKRDQRRLDQLMSGLPEVAAPGSGSDFARARGRLPLPVQGRITARFGTRRHQGDLRWTGIFLATATGNEVKAVFDGRVVFADWLQGYGLLLILEHGGGYMTLYGNNESLIHRVGDRVKAGEVVSVTGNTGNSARSGLYFEVRHQGNPRNPLRWCRNG